MKKLFFVLGFIISFTATSAQNRITGKIIDSSNNTGISYVTIQAINLEKKYSSVAASDILGNFILSVKTTGKYKLKFDAMGYSGDSLFVDITGPNTNIGQIKLVEGQQLKGVTVSARKLIMKDEGDRLIYDVLNDPEAKKLKMSDMMKKIPFITIDASDGKLRYLNDKIAKITIDGKNNEMINSGRQFPMRLIRGDVMNRIEIILPKTKDNPGDTPIINIKLEKNLPDGYAAEISAKGM